jgi:hypothetical protein
MGGRGSGRSSSFGMMADLCHEHHRIDLAWLRSEKMLEAGGWRSITWSRAGRQTGSVRVAAVPGGMALSYRQRRNGGEWQDVDEVVPIVQTATQFGGRRGWFRCLSCERRCRILYGGAHFRCRRCHRLRYDTQYEPAFARAATRALKIRERLGCKGGIDDPFPDKPKGMRWATYERLRGEEERLQGAWAQGIMARFRLGGEVGGDA